MILGIDSSAISAGCALMDSDGRIIAEQFLNTKHTHSQTLLPMVESMLKCAGVKISDLDAAAVTVGPGSFTGLRIGVSTVKGMCYGAGKKCVGISSLEAIAYNFTGTAAWTPAAGRSTTRYSAAKAESSHVSAPTVRYVLRSLRRSFPACPAG